MIILRHKFFSKKKKIGSYFVSQIEPDKNGGNDFNLLNGKLYKDLDPEIRDAWDKQFKMSDHTRYPGAVKVKGKDIYIKNWGGTDKDSGRTTYRVFVSDKAPKDAYKDWLESVEKRQNFGDLNPGEATLSNKEIKNLLRKGIKRRNIKTAAIGGTAVLGAAGVGYGVHKAVKEKNKSKKKEK